MKWINANTKLPPLGKQVIVRAKTSNKNRPYLYSVGIYCCFQDWVCDNKNFGSIFNINYWCEIDEKEETI